MCKQNEQITISTETKKNVPIYNLNITISSSGKKGSKPQTLTLARSFTEWFDEAGHFVATPFQTMLATTVPVIATLDPKRASSANATSNQTSTGDYTAEELDAILAAGGADDNSTAEVTGSSAKKGGKRRKA